MRRELALMLCWRVHLQQGPEPADLLAADGPGGAHVLCARLRVRVRAGRKGKKKKEPAVTAGILFNASIGLESVVRVGEVQRAPDLGGNRLGVGAALLAGASDDVDNALVVLLAALGTTWRQGRRKSKPLGAVGARGIERPTQRTHRSGASSCLAWPPSGSGLAPCRRGQGSRAPYHRGGGRQPGWWSAR